METNRLQHKLCRTESQAFANLWICSVCPEQQGPMAVTQNTAADLNNTMRIHRALPDQGWMELSDAPLNKHSTDNPAFTGNERFN